MESTLTREQIIEALQRLDGELERAGKKVTLYVVGGAVMCVVFEARETTRDVDAWFSEPATVREAARLVAHEMSLPENWLNDAAKAFVPEHAGFERWRSLSHLDVLVADEATMFAMKAAAARTEAALGAFEALAGGTAR